MRRRDAPHGGHSVCHLDGMAGNATAMEPPCRNVPANRVEVADGGRVGLPVGSTSLAIPARPHAAQPSILRNWPKR